MNLWKRYRAALLCVLALGVPPGEALGTLRLTTGRWSTEADIDRAAASLAAAWRALVATAR